MGHRSYREASRSNWGCADRQPDTNELKLGALLRIADATEVMAKEYNRLLNDRDLYKRWYDEARASRDRFERSNSALRRQITKLRKRLAGTQ